MLFINLIFIKLYQIGMRIKHKSATSKDAALTAYFFFTIFLTLNFFEVFMILEKHLNILIPLNKPMVIGGVFVLLLGGYFHFLKDDRFKVLVKKYSGNKIVCGTIGTIIFLLYATFSIVSIFIV